MKKYFGVFLIVSIIIIVGCSGGKSTSPGSVESVDELVGIWEQINAPGYAAFNQYFEDGTFWCSHELE